MKKSTVVSSVLLTGAMFISIPSAFAGGCAPGEPCWDEYKSKPAPAAVPRAEVEEVAPAAPLAVEEGYEEVEAEPVAMMKEESDFQFAIAPGFNVLHFDCQDAHVAGAVYGDIRKKGVPVNLRVGIEATRLNADQFQFTPESRFFQQQPDFNFYRIPVSLEYIVELAEGTEVLIGGGPDLLTATGNGSDTEVGLHLGARIEQAITEKIGVSAGAGYLWGETTNRGEDLDLDSAYTGASLGYKF